MSTGVSRIERKVGSYSLDLFLLKAALFPKEKKNPTNTNGTGAENSHAFGTGVAQEGLDQGEAQVVGVLLVAPAEGAKELSE